MCGRFTQKLTWRQIHHLYNLTAPVVLLDLQPRYNGAPEQEFAACRLEDGGNRTMVQLRWGLVPSWAQDVRIGTPSGQNTHASSRSSMSASILETCKLLTRWAFEYFDQTREARPRLKTRGGSGVSDRRCRRPAAFVALLT